MESMKRKLRNLEDRSKIFSIEGSQEEKIEKKHAEAIFEGVIAENFPRLKIVLIFPRLKILLGLSSVTEL